MQEKIKKTRERWVSRGERELKRENGYVEVKRGWGERKKLEWWLKKENKMRMMIH